MQDNKHDTTEETSIEPDVEEPDVDAIASMSRRDLMRGAAVAGGAAATGGAALSIDATSPVEEVDAIAPAVLAAGAGAAIVGAAVAGYLTRQVQQNVTGADSTVPSEYSQAAKDDALAEVRVRAASMSAASDKVFTVMENRISDSKNIAWARAKAKYIEDRSASKGHSTAKANAQGEVSSYYATVQENLMAHNNDMALKILNLANTLDTAGWSSALDPSTDPLIAQDDSGSRPSSGTIETSEFARTLVDGTSFNNIQVQYASGGDVGTKIAGGHTYHSFYAAPVGGGSYQLVYDSSRAQGLNADLKSLDSTMRTEVGTWADTLDSNRSQSEIAALPTEDPSLLASQYASESGHYGYAGADLAALGLSTAYDRSTLIYLADEDVTIEGQIYLSEDKKLDVGATYDPDQITGAVYLAYQIPESSTGTSTPSGTATATATATPTGTSTPGVPSGGTQEAGLVRLEQQFQIIEAVDGEGAQLDNLRYESPNDQTSDVSLTQEQMAAIAALREELKEAQERAIRNNGGGGGGIFDFSVGGLSGTAIAAIAALVGGSYLLSDD